MNVKELRPETREVAHENNTLEYDFLKLRKHYRLTQADLAELLKVSKNYICQIETGRKIPSQSLVELVQRIEKELAINPPAHRIRDAVGGYSLEDNPASEYMRKVWAAARNDRYLEGYILTKLKLEFPIDKPPFVAEEKDQLPGI
jgi:transcriptional regulator with XRE-family HTH domain